MSIEEVVIFLLIVLAVATVSATISASKIFKPVRELPLGFFSAGLKCWYCVAHWTAFIFVGFSPLWASWYQFFLLSFAAVAIVSFLAPRIIKNLP